MSGQKLQRPFDLINCNKTAETDSKEAVVIRNVCNRVGKRHRVDHSSLDLLRIVLKFKDVEETGLATY